MEVVKGGQGLSTASPELTGATDRQQGQASRMIAVAVAVIVGVVAVTCGIVADSNHPDSLAFLGVMVQTTAAQIFLAGAICTWALFAALWLLSAGIRRSRERGIELRALRAAPTEVDLAAPKAAPSSSPDLLGLLNAMPSAGFPDHAFPGFNAHHTAAFATSFPDPYAFGSGVFDFGIPDPGVSDSSVYGSGVSDSDMSGPRTSGPVTSDTGPPVCDLSDSGQADSDHPDPADPAYFPGLHDPADFSNLPGIRGGRAFPDPDETCDPFPPGSGLIGPALSDGTSPAAGLDGVDPRRARKRTSE
jgi:hypothetical protein